MYLFTGWGFASNVGATVSRQTPNLCAQVALNLTEMANA